MTTKQKPKGKGGRPKHVAAYESGKKAQDKFADAMRAVLKNRKSADGK